MPDHYIGVDVGGTQITAGVVTKDCRILSKESVPTRLPRPEAEVEAEIAKLCYAVCVDSGLSMEKDIAWVGVGTPGSVNPRIGIVEFNANFGYHNWHLVQAVEKLIDKKVYIENDANAAAYGELLAGGAAGYRNAAVSYTHLDVYKRQPQSERLNGGLAIMKSALSCGWQSLKKVSALNRPKSASMPRMARFICAIFQVVGLESCP